MKGTERLAIRLAIEYAWNVYPSTNLSSSVLLASNALLLAGVWLGNSNGFPASNTLAKTQ